MTEPRPVAKGLLFLVRFHTKENSNVSNSVSPLNGVSRKKLYLQINETVHLENTDVSFQWSCAAYIKLQNMSLCKFSSVLIRKCGRAILLRLLHSGCSPWRPRFSPSQVRLGFVVDKVALPSITLVSPLSYQHTITPRPYFHPSRFCINSETHMSLSNPLTKGRVQPDKHNL
jgi:hypothetical protein